MEIFNNFTPNLRFMCESSEKSSSFLDFIITVSEQKLKTNLYIKYTDRYQQLHYAFSHPEHDKRSIVFSQTLRISRLCSEEDDFNNYRSQKKSVLVQLHVCVACNFTNNDWGPSQKNQIFLMVLCQSCMLICMQLCMLFYANVK